MTQTQDQARNLTMMMDEYELTMANAYFNDPTIDNNTLVSFDVFYRANPDGGGFAIFAGLQQVKDYILNMHFTDEDIKYLRSVGHFTDDFLEYLWSFKFTGSVDAFKEGTVMYPNEPIITVTAPIIEAQLVETEILAQVNHQSLIATKASRIVRAANGRGVSDFGARRAHNNDAAIYGARAAYIGGVGGTATVSAGQYFNIPIGGTMAHSYVMYFTSEDNNNSTSELAAFRSFAKSYPNNCILLVDTYNVLKSGVPNAIKVFNEMREAGIQSKSFGIRIDSGDLAYLTKKARKMLDDAGFPDAKIIVSNSLDEYTITSILQQGGQVNSFGVGERLITAKSEPVFGAVYKLCAVQNPKTGEVIPKIKISETVEKITNPGLKDVYRIKDANGRAVADLLAIKGEKVDMNQEGGYKFIDPEQPWKSTHIFSGCTAELLQHPLIRDGEAVCPDEDILDIKNRVKDQLETCVWQEEQRFENPHKHYLDMTPAYYNMKMELLREKDK
ncbi:MAG: nicotinate phosphoribosyltransferase [Pseudobutyrivibrio sp.]|nr:nicotinate phosphoribosyltransferase [Pseudobutyrivibrio sp.]